MPNFFKVYIIITELNTITPAPGTRLRKYYEICQKGAACMTINEKALTLHETWNGKLETVSKTPVKSREDLSQIGRAHV